MLGGELETVLTYGESPMSTKASVREAVARRQEIAAAKAYVDATHCIAEAKAAVDYPARSSSPAARAKLPAAGSQGVWASNSFTRTAAYWCARKRAAPLKVQNLKRQRSRVAWRRSVHGAADLLLVVVRNAQRQPRPR